MQREYTMYVVVNEEEEYLTRRYIYDTLIATAWLFYSKAAAEGNAEEYNGKVKEVTITIKD